MTKADVLAGCRGKPVPFEYDGFKCLLRPLSRLEQAVLFAWFKEQKETVGAGLELQAKFILMAVCDEAGTTLLDPADLDQFSAGLVAVLADEIASRNGMGKTDAGKGPSPTTGS